jgi:hypothetical protein
VWIGLHGVLHQQKLGHPNGNRLCPILDQTFV